MGCAQARLNFSLEPVEVVEGGLKVAVLKRALGSPNGGEQRLFVASGKIRLLQQEGDMIECFTGGDNVNLELLRVRLNAIADAQGEVVCTQWKHNGGLWGLRNFNRGAIRLML